MKVILLGAGYGTRLERDLKAYESGTYSHLIGVPKPLLPIGKYPLATHWMKAISSIPDIDKVYVVTNASNHSKFEEWAKEWNKVELISDGSVTNETRSGAVACMNLPVKHFNISDDTIIIAGDTLLYDDFDLKHYIEKFNSFKSTDEDASMLLYVTCTDEEVHKYGILETDDTGKVVGFMEKPQPSETTSRKECPCFYFFNKNTLGILEEFLNAMKDEPMKKRDATGNFVAYLYKRKAVYATEISGRFDVGGLESYVVCHQHFLNKNS